MNKTIKEINNKTYYKEEDNLWYSLDKNGTPRKVTSEKLFKKLDAEEITGLGDVISKITKTLGIEECESCIRRRNKLNNILPWMQSNIRKITDEEIQLMNEINSHYIIQNHNVIKLFKLYNSIFGTKTERCNCPGLIKRLIGRINAEINNQSEKI